MHGRLFIKQPLITILFEFYLQFKVVPVHYLNCEEYKFLQFSFIKIRGRKQHIMQIDVSPTVTIHEWRFSSLCSFIYVYTG